MDPTSESDGTTSEETKTSSRERALVAKSKRRHKLLDLSAAHPTFANLTLLERTPVQPNTEKSYEEAIARFLKFADESAGPLVEDEEVDDAMVQFMNRRFSHGLPAHDGEVTLAGLMHFQQRYSKAGTHSLPRSWRALKGWRRRAPSRSRVAFPFLVWAGVIWDLCLRGFWSMGLYLLWTLTTYNRPSEPLSVCRRDLNRPVLGASPEWTVLLWPSERDGRSKVLGSDDSLALSSKMVPWLPALLETLIEGKPDERIFAFDYQDFAREFNKTRRRLRIKKLVPYQARHSGVSIDLCLGYRSIAEAKNRGRWASEKSMLRYNKSAKLAQVLKQFDARQLDYFRACESRLEALFFGQAKAEDLQLP